MKRHPIRVLYRLVVFLGIAVFSILDAMVFIQLAGHGGDYRRRALWLQKWSRRTLRSFGWCSTYSGEPPKTGILVSNHLSYLDILVLAARHPTIFVAKREVRSWPLIGWCAQCAGTLFINREKKSDVKRLETELVPVIESGVCLCLFLEGTSTGGQEVLPFRSGLLAPAEAMHWPVTPVWIGYRLEEGSVSDEVCYWRDMVFFPHFLNLLSKVHLRPAVVFGDSLPPGLDRKTMATQLHEQISQHNRDFHAD